MTNTWTTQGIEYAMRRGFTDTGSTPTQLRSLVVDDSTTPVTLATTQFNGTSIEANLFDATPTRSAQTVSGTVTFGLSEANYIHRRFALTNAAAATSGPVLGIAVAIDDIASLGISKTADFIFEYNWTVTASNDSTGSTIWVNQGLQVMLDALFALASPRILSMGFDDNTATPTATTTSLQGATAAAVYDFDSASFASGTVTCVATIPFGSAGTDMNGHVIRRFWLTTQAANVAETASAITGACACVYSQQQGKTTSFSPTLRMTATGVSS